MDLICLDLSSHNLYNPGERHVSFLWLLKKTNETEKLSVLCVGRSVASFYLIFTVVLSVLRVPYSDDDVGRAEVKVRMISDVVDTDILLQTDDLNNTETNVYGLFLFVPLSPTNIQTLIVFTSFKITITVFPPDWPPRRHWWSWVWSISPHTFCLCDRQTGSRRTPRGPAALGLRWAHMHSLEIKVNSVKHKYLYFLDSRFKEYYDVKLTSMDST